MNINSRPKIFKYSNIRTHPWDITNQDKSRNVLWVLQKFRRSVTWVLHVFYKIVTGVLEKYSRSSPWVLKELPRSVTGVIQVPATRCGQLGQGHRLLPAAGGRSEGGALHGGGGGGGYSVQRLSAISKGPRDPLRLGCAPSGGCRGSSQTFRGCPVSYSTA